MRARDIMTSPVITVTPAVPLKGAAALMVSHGFTALPVVDDVMTAPAVAVDAAVPAEVLARLTIDDRRRCVPIVDGSTAIGVPTTDEDTERVLVALADAVPGVLRTRVLTGGQR